MSATGGEKKPEDGETAVAVAGELLYFGGTDWPNMGRKVIGTTPSSPNLLLPTRLRPFLGVDIRSVASGCTSCHCVALDVEGRCYTWGRNEKGQLGHGDTVNRYSPTIVSELSKYKIVSASAGKNHTVVVTDEGKSFSFGMNKHGQIGSGSIKNEIEPSPVPCLVSQITGASCGADFTVWLSSVEGSSILSAGHPLYGQLGHGTDNEYNSKDSSVRLVYEPQSRPRAIEGLSEKTIVKVACGANHTIAVDSNGFVYTWGYGAYGRLGHRGNKDEWVPRLIEVFQKHNVLPPTAVVSAGFACCACTAGGGQLYMWGKVKNVGEEVMYPKPVLDLSGWNIRSMALGHSHHIVAADNSCISWGHSQNGELGYGPLGQKSSANPKKVDILDGMHVTSVAAGLGLSLIVVDRTNVGDKLDQLEVYDGETPIEVSIVFAAELEEKDDKKITAAKGSSKNGTPKPSASSKKGTPKPSASSKKRKNPKSSSESDEEEPVSEEDEDDEDSDDTKGKRGGKAFGRGRGRGAKKVAPELKGSGRGRGRSKSSTTGSGKRGKSRK